ncbi:TIGR04351 family putative TOMM peptide [Streptomyces sp. 5-8]|uniref:TIGR04351 family putative TOMM peptide n=1 Tax=Streptomyces musisoli TaxID=2802280 RepID=A0ABS1P457_9ACTN|nr:MULTISPECIES: TIGR04351 family putative TOMM peptide [Streptomyces]MBL1106837.1 TIGR04351 family putative TOMM peptide [Streptomyces musisoli]MBY8842179.1 TIGR04351 family putative TOMM peptide [Streptomyces sp. SP2-10]
MSLDHDWRFAELVARTWTETDLKERYLADPHRVLAEAGIDLAPGAPAPALPDGADLDVVVAPFDTLPAVAPAAGFCLSLVDPPSIADLPVVRHSRALPEALAA